MINMEEDFWTERSRTKFVVMRCTCICFVRTVQFFQKWPCITVLCHFQLRPRMTPSNCTDGHRISWQPPVTGTHTSSHWINPCPTANQGPRYICSRYLSHSQALIGWFSAQWPISDYDTFTIVILWWQWLAECLSDLHMSPVESNRRSDFSLLPEVYSHM